MWVALKWFVFTRCTCASDWTVFQVDFTVNSVISLIHKQCIIVLDLLKAKLIYWSDR
jgi:hypothetical protein